MSYNRDTYKIVDQYSTVRCNLILRENFNSDVLLSTRFLHKNEVLCNEMFGQLGQKIKQGFQSGTQTVKNKLLKSLVDMVINKLPSNIKQQLVQVASQGPDALQQYLQKNGDPNIAKQLASQNQQPAQQQQQPAQQQQQPAQQQQQPAQTVNKENFNLITLLGLLNSESNFLTEAKMSDRSKFSNFQKTLQKLSLEISDPQIKQQASSLLTYIQNNYSKRGKLLTKNQTNQQPATQPQTQEPTQQQPVPQQQQTQEPTQQQLAPKQQTQEPTQQQLAPQQQTQEPTQQQPANQQPSNTNTAERNIPGLEVPDYNNPVPLKNETGAKDNTIDSAIANVAGFASKVSSLLKNNSQLNSQGLLGILLAIAIAAGGASIVAPLISQNSSNSNPESQVKSLLPSQKNK